MAKATYLLRKAGELVKEKSYQDAVEVYLQATETDPSDSRAWFGLGVCLYKVSNLDVAHIALERAQKMGYPRASEALARVEAAEERRAAEGKGAKATMAPSEAQRRAASRPAAAEGPPPRPLTREPEERIDLGRFLRVMLVENLESDRAAIAEAIEGTLKDAEVSPVEYGISTSQTMSGTVHYDVAILDWDTAPDAARGLIQILKIKRPSLLVICLTEKWDPETAAEILEAGADCHLVKEPHFALAIPLLLAQWARRDRAVAREQEARDKEGLGEGWAESLDALGDALILVGADFTVLQANQSAMKKLRRGEDELLGRSYSLALYGQEEPPDSCPLVQALERGESAAGTLQHAELDKAFRIHAWPVLTYAGHVGSAVALLHEETPTERADEELKTREWLYRSLAEKANAGVAMVGSDGKLEYVNQGLCSMLDQTEQELVGHPIESLAPVQEQEKLRECLTDAVKKGEAGERIVLDGSDGAAFPAEVRIASFATAEGTCLVVTLIGVSELEQAEQQLWSEAHRFAMVLDEGVDKLECGVVVLDTEGRVSWLNSVAAAILDGDKDELAGKDYLKVVRSKLEPVVEGGAGFVAELERSRAAGEPLEDYLLRPTSPGEETLAYWSTPIEGGGASVSRIEHIYRSAEPAAAAELTVPSGQEALSGIAEAMSEMLFTADSGGKITWVNRAASDVAGHGARKLKGMALEGLADGDSRERVRQLLRRALDRGGQAQKGEVLMQHADGQRYWAELTLISVREEGSPDSRIVQGVLRDITEHKINAAIRDIVTGQRPV
jgi:PAS domain S-box-containing protein